MMGYLIMNDKVDSTFALKDEDEEKESTEKEETSDKN